MSKIAVAGNASGTGTLTIAAPNTNSDRTLTLPDVTATVITDSAGVLNIGSGQIYKDASGNVGIGTSSPTAKLVVSGGGMAVQGNGYPATGAGWEFYTDTTTGSWAQSFSRTSSAWLDANWNALTHKFSTSGAERVRIDSSGNVGIGTSSVSTNFRQEIVGLAGSNTGPASSGTTQNASAVMRIRPGGGFTATLDIGQGGGTGSWIQSTDTSNLATTYPLLLNPIGGNVGIGTSSPDTLLNIQGVNPTLLIQDSDEAGDGFIKFQTANGTQRGFIQTAMTANVMLLGTGTSERMRIDGSGNLTVGATSVPEAARVGISSTSASAVPLVVQQTAAGSTTQNSVVFYRNSTTTGTIQVTGTTTSYNTSSDYRLKENVQPMIGALAKVAALKPCTYMWKLDGSLGEGFIAHELAEVVPQAVGGQKDAVDAEGNPKYQGIDTSFLVATLTAAIQEQQAIIEQLQADVATLKGAA